jgi:hypothetical protein
MSADVENLSLLIKFMGMTRSNSDAEALIALRKANEHLDRFKATWEDLLRSRVKITVVADPFANLPEPPLASANSASANGSSPHYAAPPPPPPPPPRRTPSAASSPPPPRPASSAAYAAAHSAAYSATYNTPPRPRGNQYAGNCHKCGKHHGVLDALAVKVGGRWKVECRPNSGCGSALDNFFTSP